MNNSEVWRRKQWKRYRVLRYLDSEFNHLEYVRDTAEDYINRRFIDVELLIECKRLGYAITPDAKPGDGQHILRGKTGVECRGGFKGGCIVCVDGVMRHEAYHDSNYKEEEFRSQIVPEYLESTETNAASTWLYFDATASKNKVKHKRSDDDDDTESETDIKDHASASTDMQSSTDPVPVPPKEPGPDTPTNPAQSQQ